MTYYVGEHYEVENGTGTSYYYANSDRVAKKNSTGTYYYHPDHLGSTSVMTDSSGNLVEKTKYAPFGAVLSGGFEKYGYTGQETDDTGLMYYHARYYDPALMRFVEADPVVQDVYDPQSLNRYSYVRNNPLKLVDPTGNSWVDGLAKILSGGWKAIKSLFGKAEGAASEAANVAKTTAVRVIPTLTGKAEDLANYARSLGQFQKGGNQYFFATKDSGINTLEDLSRKSTAQGKFFRYDLNDKGLHFGEKIGYGKDMVQKYHVQGSDKLFTMDEIDSQSLDYHFKSGDTPPPGYLTVTTDTAMSQPDYGPLAGMGIYLKDGNMGISPDLLGIPSYTYDGSYNPGYGSGAYATVA